MVIQVNYRALSHLLYPISQMQKDELAIGKILMQLEFRL